MKHVAYLALGTNLGNKEENLQTALKQIAERIGTLSAISSVYKTEPWGFQSDNFFLNMVAEVRTVFSPLQLLDKTQIIEKDMGRTQKSNGTYQDRLIDIDILLYDNLIFQSEKLHIPHPLFHQRRFVLEPLAEIAPDAFHPVLEKFINQLLSDNFLDTNS